MAILSPGVSTMVGNGILNVVEGEDLTGGAAWKPVSVDASGGPPDFTGFVDDGFDVRDPIYGGDLYQPSLEAIQSVRIVRGFDRSKYGGEPSVVYISTKSGTNQYHGFAFEYNEVGALSARPFGRNYSVPLTYNQAGWSKASLVIGITARATRHRKRGGKSHDGGDMGRRRLGNSRSRLAGLRKDSAVRVRLQRRLGQPCQNIDQR